LKIPSEKLEISRKVDENETQRALNRLPKINPHLPDVNWEQVSQYRKDWEAMTASVKQIMLAKGKDGLWTNLTCVTGAYPAGLEPDPKSLVKLVYQNQKANWAEILHSIPGFEFVKSGSQHYFRIYKEEKKEDSQTRSTKTLSRVEANDDLAKRSKAADSEHQPLDSENLLAKTRPRHKISREAFREEDEKDLVGLETDKDSDFINMTSKIGTLVATLVEQEINEMKPMLESKLEKLFSDWEAKVAEKGVFDNLDQRQAQAASHFPETIDGKQFIDKEDKGFVEKLRKVREEICEMEMKQPNTHRLLLEAVHEFQIAKKQSNAT
jgi:hypothetical protein